MTQSLSMRMLTCYVKPQATAVLQNLAKNSNVNFSACVKFHVENEWEILRMCEIDV